MPRQSALREPFLEAAHSRVTEAAWEKAFMEGRAMGLDEAVEYVLVNVEIDGLRPPCRSKRRQANRLSSLPLERMRSQPSSARVLPTAR